MSQKGKIIHGIQSELRSSPHFHLYSPKTHPKITSTTHERSSSFIVGGVDDTGLAPGLRYKTTMVPVWKIDPIEGN